MLRTLGGLGLGASCHETWNRKAEKLSMPSLLARLQHRIRVSTCSCSVFLRKQCLGVPAWSLGLRVLVPHVEQFDLVAIFNAAS